MKYQNERKQSDQLSTFNKMTTTLKWTNQILQQNTVELLSGQSLMNEHKTYHVNKLNVDKGNLTTSYRKVI